ncbi:unnamed protein product [Peronospora belbahrii]|uniref:Uncharacterized protein n=1 Tax=Peronospora belbahrii TaxID=622444 RepID=A0AAU9KPX4_9STRA|nr:unnamed protein product [Peronospora belbahrii]
MSFETESISELNFNHSYISGLLDFFKIKLQSSPHVKEKCRIETDKSEDLAISMTVSASFAFSWNRTNDPREVAISENPRAWRSLESQQLTETNNQSRRIRNKLFGENHPIPLLGSSTSPLDKMDLTSAGHSCVKKPRLLLSKRVAILVQVCSNSRELHKDIMGSELSPPMPLIFSPSKVLNTPSAGQCGEAAQTQLLSTVPELRLRGIRRIVLELFNDGENEQDKDGGENEEYSRRLSDNVGAAMTSISSIQHGAPLGELVSILATSMSQLYSINSMSLSRVKFVKALRERWLKQELLPFMSTSTDEGGGASNSTLMITKSLKQQLQVAFEMALDACWKLVRLLEAVEALVTKAMALLHYFLASNEEQRHLPL